MKPPALARALLVATADAADAEFVAGDLHEEFVLICESRGRSEGNRWYRRQVLRSVAPLLEVRIRSGEMTAVLLRAFLSVTLPLVLLDKMWGFVYSQIPLKDGLNRAPQYLAANLILTCACAAMNTSPARGVAAAAGSAIAAALGAAAALAASRGTAPPLYVIILLLAAPACSLAARWWQKEKETV